MSAMSPAAGHKVGQGNRPRLLIFLSQDAAAWRPSDGRCAEGTLSAGSESPPCQPTPGTNPYFPPSSLASAQPVRVTAGPSGPRCKGNSRLSDLLAAYQGDSYGIQGQTSKTRRAEGGKRTLSMHLPCFPASLRWCHLQGYLE